MYKEINSVIAKKSGLEKIIISDNVIGYFLDYLSALEVKKNNKQTNILIISDKITYKLFAKKITNEIQKLPSIFPVEIILEHDIQPSFDYSTLICKKITEEKIDLLVAVGSGTINDLCKYASYLAGIPYILLPTAASMNGYASANSSLIENGIKKTFNSRQPKAIFCDINIIKDADIRLTKSGFADLISSNTSKIDWKLSNLILNTTYMEEPFDLTKDIEKELCDNIYDLINKRDANLTALLMEGLILSGIGMTIAGSSMPASGSEHLLAHYVHMFYMNNIKGNFFHGEEMAVTSIEILKLQNKIFARNNPPMISETIIDKDYLKKKFGKDLAEECINNLNYKYISKELADDINNMLANKWQDIRKWVSDNQISYDEYHNILSKAELSLSPKSIGWDNEFMNDALQNAKFIRNRYSCLDL